MKFVYIVFLKSLVDFGDGKIDLVCANKDLARFRVDELKLLYQADAYYIEMPVVQD